MLTSVMVMHMYDKQRSETEVRNRADTYWHADNLIQL